MPTIPPAPPDGSPSGTPDDVVGSSSPVGPGLGLVPGGGPFGRGGAEALCAPGAVGARAPASSGAAETPSAEPAPARGFFARVRATLAHAFTLEPAEGPLGPDDEALLDKVADAVARRGLTTPAVLWLESLKPVHFVGAQALYALRPLAHVLVEPGAFDRAARVLERRDGIEQLIRRIEARA